MNLRPGDGIGIRVGLRSQILGVRVSSGAPIKGETMKATIFENIYNKERFVTNGKKDTKYIDGIEYVKLVKEGTLREVLVRRDFLKKVK